MRVNQENCLFLNGLKTHKKSGIRKDSAGEWAMRLVHHPKSPLLGLRPPWPTNLPSFCGLALEASLHSRMDATMIVIHVFFFLNYKFTFDRRSSSAFFKSFFSLYDWIEKLCILKYMQGWDRPRAFQSAINFLSGALCKAHGPSTF